MQGNSEQPMLTAILDLLVPARADGKVRGAGALGVGDFVWAQGQNDPALKALLAQAKALQQQDQQMSVALVECLEREMPDEFATLLRLTYMGYYSRADVRADLGLSAEPVHPKGYAVEPEPEALIAALVAPVKARGGMFREC